MLQLLNIVIFDFYEPLKFILGCLLSWVIFLFLIGTTQNFVVPCKMTFLFNFKLIATLGQLKGSTNNIVNRKERSSHSILTVFLQMISCWLTAVCGKKYTPHLYFIIWAANRKSEWSPHICVCCVLDGRVEPTRGNVWWWNGAKRSENKKGYG